MNIALIDFMRISGLLFLFSLLCLSCDNNNNPSPVGSSASANWTTCSAFGTAQDTITVNGTRYYVVVSSGASNVFIAELAKINGPYATSISVSSLQTINGVNCAQSNNVTVMIAPQTKAYTFGSFPSWAVDTNTISIVKLDIDSSTYFLRDNKLNQ